ncbi:hypothetical protein ACTXT7_007372 [Hymenolepis weldensis]
MLYIQGNRTSLVHLQAPRRPLQPTQQFTCVAHEQKVSAGLGEYAAKSSKVKTGPLDIILDVFSLPSLGNSETPDIQPSNQQNLQPKRSRKPPKKFQVDPTLKSYEGKLSPAGDIPQTPNKNSQIGFLLRPSNFFTQSPDSMEESGTVFTATIDDEKKQWINGYVPLGHPECNSTYSGGDHFD